MKKETLFWGLILLGGMKLLNGILAPKSQTSQSMQDVDQRIQKSQNGGLRQSFTSQQYQSFAFSIYEALKWSISFADDPEVVERILKGMQNDLDVEILIKAYGKRRLFAYGEAELEAKTLWEAIHSDLPVAYIQRINNDWQTKGIRYSL